MTDLHSKFEAIQEYIDIIYYICIYMERETLSTNKTK